MAIYETTSPAAEAPIPTAGANPRGAIPGAKPESAADFLRGVQIAARTLKEIKGAGAAARTIEASPDTKRCDAIARAIKSMVPAPEAEIAGFAAVLTDAVDSGAPDPEYFATLTPAELGLGPAPMHDATGAPAEATMEGVLNIVEQACAALRIWRTAACDTDFESNASQLQVSLRVIGEMLTEAESRAPTDTGLGLLFGKGLVWTAEQALWASAIREVRTGPDADAMRTTVTLALQNLDEYVEHARDSVDHAAESPRPVAAQPAPVVKGVAGWASDIECSAPDCKPAVIVNPAATAHELAGWAQGQMRQLGIFLHAIATADDERDSVGQADFAAAVMHFTEQIEVVLDEAVKRSA